MRLALDSLRANKFRSGMTILGVMIGIGAVILVNTIIDGFTEYAETSISRIGNNVMYITKWDSETDYDNLTDRERRRPNIRMKEAYAVQEMCPLVKAVSPEKKTRDNIAKYGNRSIRTPDDVRGCWPQQAVVTNRDMAYGRFIDQTDMERKSMVCVIGPDIADALFDFHADAIGKTIKVNGRDFEVIGVQERIDDFFGISENDFIYMPMTTFDRLYPGVEQIYLLVSAVSREQFDEAKDEVINALRRVRQVRPEEQNNFGILHQDLLREEIGSVTSKAQLGATAVAMVSLFVGIIGVTNIMLIAVTQRTREIGIRKAVGARRRNIMFQFLVEAATVTLVGGLVGIAFGALSGWAVTSALEWRYYLSPLWIVVAVSLSVACGMLAGWYPAWRAARVDPIVALHYE